VVDKTKTAWHRVVPNPARIGQALEQIVRCQDVPFGSASGVIPQHFLMKRVREAGVKVLLDGQGGDELFAGYRGHYMAHVLDLLRSGHLPTAARELCLLGNSSVNVAFLSSTLLKRILPKVVPATLLSRILRRSRPEIRYLGPDFLRAHRDRLSLYQERGLPGLNEYLAGTMTGYEFKYLLRYEDRNSMAYSIEARTPFADYLPLIEFLFRTPGAYKIHDGWSKYLLREATKDVLPEAIRWRKDKQGFPAPGNLWLRYLRPILAPLLADDTSGYWDGRALARDMEAMIVRPESNESNLFLWRVLILATWLRVFKVS
jgi:asparagine synthase (glutamine-hydrolysing)